MFTFLHEAIVRGPGKGSLGELPSWEHSMPSSSAPGSPGKSLTSLNPLTSGRKSSLWEFNCGS